MIQIQKKDDIFDVGQSQITVFRSSDGDFVRFNLFPYPGKESAVSALDELKIFVKVVPDKAASASRSNIKKSTSSPVSLQVEIKKKGAVESQTLGSLSILKPVLKTLKFYVNGVFPGLALMGNQSSTDQFVISESLLSFAQEEGSLSNPGQLIARIPRDQTARRAIPVSLPLNSLIAENQQIIVQIVGTKYKKVSCSQLVTIPKPFVVGKDQISQRITTLNFTRADRGRVRFTAYLEKKPIAESITFCYRVWSDSEKHRSMPVQTTIQASLATRSASISVLCTEKEYVEVYAYATDGSGRVCGQPARTLVIPTHKKEDLSAVILRQQDLSGIVAEAVGIPERSTRINVIRKNLDTRIEDALGSFPVSQGRAQFSDPQIVEQFFPSFSSRFSYEIYIERDGMFQKSSHELLVNFNLINDFYSFSPVFSQLGNVLSINMTHKSQESTLDNLTKDLNSKALTDAFSDEIKQIRSQTSEKFLYDVYTVSEIDGEQTYIGEFSEDLFSVNVKDSHSVFVLPKTSTPRQQISAIKKLVQQPSLVSKSRVSRSSAKSLSSNLDATIVVDDGVKSKIYTQRSLIDGLISSSEAAKTSNFTGHVYCYATRASRRDFPKISNSQARRLETQQNIVSWTYPTSESFSHFLVSAKLTSGATVQICRIPSQKSSARYQFIDPVFGKVPGKVVYTVAPVDFSGIAGPAQSIVLESEEVQIG